MAITPSFTFYGLLASIILYYTSSVEAAVQRVSYDDSKITYYPSLCNEDCSRVCRYQWWPTCALADGTKSMRTKGGDTSANFSFKGSSITWYTRTTTVGARASVYIDNVLAATVDTSSPTTNEANPIFTKSGLDPTSSHVISVVFNNADFTDDRLAEKFIDIHAFEYDDGVGAGGGASTTQSSAVSQASPSGSSVSSGNTVSGSSSGSTSVSGGSSSTSNRSANPSSTTGPNSLAPVLVTFTNGTIQTVYNGDLTVGSGLEGKTLSIVGIVGLVLGVAAAMCLFFFCFLFVRRRRKQSKIPVASVGDGRDRLYPPTSVSGSEAPSNSTSRYRLNAGQPFDSSDTFQNLRDSHFYTLRNPEVRNVQPIILYDAPDSKRRLAQLDRHDRSEPDDDEYSSPIESHYPPLSQYQASNVPGRDEMAGDRTDYAPASPASATQMTVTARDSLGAHAFGMSQAPSERRSSGGTWLPNTPPPVYRR